MDISKKIVFDSLIFLICINLTCGSYLDIKEVAKNLSEDIKQIKNNELGVPFILKLYNNFLYMPGNVDVEKSINAMVVKLESKINDVFSGLDIAKNIIQNIVTLKNISLSSAVTPCFHKDSSHLVIDTSFINNKTVLHSLGSRYVLDKMKKNMGSTSVALKRQYIVSDSEIQNLKHSPFYLCIECDETMLWKNYMLRRKYQPKNVVLILDNGGSINHSQLHVLKAVAKKVVTELTSRDRIALITINSNYSYFESDCDYSKELINVDTLEQVNASYIKALNVYIDNLNGDSGATNHLLGIKKGLEIVSKSVKLIQNETVMILYVSRGLLSSLMEPKHVLEAVAKYTDDSNVSLIINTCAIAGDPVMYEPQFLRDIAEQNYTKYNISYKQNSFRKIGGMLTVNNSRNVPFVVNQFYNIFNPKAAFYTEKKISFPHWDPSAGELTVSFTRGVLMENNFFLLGADVYFASLVEDLTYYSSNQDDSYGFLMDLTGKILIHPSFLKLSPLSHQVLFADVENFEKVADIHDLRRRLLTEENGIHDTFRNNSTDVVKYTWSRVSSYYVLCLVINTKYEKTHKSFRPRWYQSSSKSRFLYHNLDDYKLCRHNNLVATTDVASLYLSTSCFQSPFTASRTTQDKLSQGYLAYLKDDTRLLANPGLKDEVRDEVFTLWHVVDYLRKKHLSSTISKYIVRRYASSYTGVLQMFPGSVLRQGLQPTKRPWFLKALQHKEKITLVPPYLDKGGAGYIVTLAYATSQLVVALDVTYGYMLKLLLNHVPACLSEKRITCFLIDDQGYIIYHPNLMDVNGVRPVVEQQHIVHKESLVSNDILNHKHFIKKMLCNNYGDNTIQRYYRLNTSFTDVLVNFVPGEHCVTYRITSVPHTNIFVGIVNASCDFLATFCPCSIVDRLCLNCNRMEQKECECPCECPLEDESDVCEDNTYVNMTNNPPCSWYTDESSLDMSFTIETKNHLETCFPVNCQSQKLYLDCLGLVGCEWCKYDMDGNYLRKPFCATVNTCFNGFFDLTSSHTGNIAASSDYSPVGPILGSIIAMCILFILLFICYRSYTNPLTERLYLSSTQDQLRMSDLNINNTFHDLGNHRDKLLQEDNRNVISPYCMAGSYKQSTIAADSDHGYSTMTPHDESEHLSLAPVEVESLEDDILSDSTSIHTSISAKDGLRAVSVSSPMYTKISNKNCIIVPVTVHRNMEKT